MKKALLGLLALVFVGVMAPAAKADVADDAKQLCLKAASFLDKEGKDKAFPAFNDKAGQFQKGELYAFVINFQGAWEAYPPKPEGVGTQLIHLKDVDGKQFVKEMIDVAQSKGEGWVNYKWTNPASGKIEAKSTYVKRAGDVFVGVGYYHQ